MRRIDNVIWTDARKELTQAAGLNALRGKKLHEENGESLIFTLFSSDASTLPRSPLWVCVFCENRPCPSVICLCLFKTVQVVSLETMENVVWYLINTFKGWVGGLGGVVWEHTKTWNQYSAWQGSLTTQLFTVAVGWEGRYSHIHHSEPWPDNGKLVGAGGCPGNKMESYGKWVQCRAGPSVELTGTLFRVFCWLFIAVKYQMFPCM